MCYTEVEIKTVNTALSKMKNQAKLVSGHEVRQAMAMYGDPYAMVEVMKNDLKLIVCQGDNWTLTAEGKRAARMGFKRYIRYLKIKDFFALWGPVVSIAAALVSIIGAVVSWFS